MNILDLPIERQREIADRQGLPLAAWQKKMRESNVRFQAAQDRIIASEGVRPPEATEAEIDRFQARVDDEVLTNAVIQRRKQAESGNP